MQRFVDTVKPLVGPARRRSLAAARFRMRMPTARGRLLPDFLVIGTMRGGTSSLYKYLSYHPCIAPSLRKEIEYFSDNYGRGLRWYRAHFPLRWRAAAARHLQGRPLLAFEASPYYLFHPHAAGRAAKLLPDAKIVVLLRNPVDRAFSHYQHMAQLGFETLPFEDAVASEPDRLRDEIDRMSRDAFYSSKAHRRFSYVSRGLYADQLEAWFESFPRDRFLLIKSEDLYADVADTYRQILEFLGLPDWQLRAFTNYSYLGARGKSQGRLDPATRRRLAAMFAPHNARLYELVGRDFDWESAQVASPGRGGD